MEKQKGIVVGPPLDDDAEPDPDAELLLVEALDVVLSPLALDDSALVLPFVAAPLDAAEPPAPDGFVESRVHAAKVTPTTAANARGSGDPIRRSYALIAARSAEFSVP